MARVLAGEEELEENHVGELEGLFFLVRDVVGEDAGSGEPVVPVVDAAGPGGPVSLPRRRGGCAGGWCGCCAGRQ